MRVPLRKLLFVGAALGGLLVSATSQAAATYTYDELGRIRTVTYTDGKQIIYTYDAAGNRTQHTVSATTVNRPPVAVDDVKTTTEAVAVTFDPRINDSDPDGNALTITNVSNGESGTAAVTGGGTSVTYTPALGRRADDIISYSISDGNGMSASANVTISIGNAPPVAANDAVTVFENASVTFDPRPNDTDPGQDPVTVTAKTNGTKGTATIGAGGETLTYVPNPTIFGADTFTYTISDDSGGTSTASVAVTIVSTNKPPVAANDAQTISYNTAKVFDPRPNDSDPDGDALIVTGKSNGAKGTVTIGAGGTSLTYTPISGSSGTDTFTYTVSDPENATSTATVAIDITPNGLPVVVNDQYNVTKNVARTFDPRLNDYDPDGTAITVTAATNGTKGTATIGSGGTSVTYTPNLNALGTDSITYTLSDIWGATATATVSINIQATNTAPVAVADNFFVDGITTFLGDIDPRWNDTDANGDSLTVTNATTSTASTVTISNGIITYRRNSNKPTASSPNKTDSITYTVSDGRGGTSTTTIAVTLHYALDCGGTPCQ